MKIGFFVPGIPVPGGSKRAMIIHQKGCPAGRRSNRGPCACKPFTTVIDAAGQPNKDWRTMVATCAIEAMRDNKADLFDGPLEVTMIFYVPRPKHHFGKKGLLPSAPPFPIGKPDVLKLARSTEDALKGILWRDDSANVVLTLVKYYACVRKSPGVSIYVAPIGQLDLEGFQRSLEYGPNSSFNISEIAELQK